MNGPILHNINFDTHLTLETEPVWTPYGITPMSDLPLGSIFESTKKVLSLPLPYNISPGFYVEIVTRGTRVIFHSARSFISVSAGVFSICTASVI